MPKPFIQWEQLWNRARQEFALGENSIHGVDHWLRVEANGLDLARENGADEDVIRLFALLHDIKRESDGRDPEHGRRAAQFAREIRGENFDLENERFDLLCEAIAYHADGTLSENITIGTCWDADRFDYSRVGVAPSARFMSTQVSRRRLGFNK